MQHLRRLKIREVERIVGFKKSKIYNLIKQGRFPKPHKDGRQTFWFERDIQQYLAKFA